MTQRQIQILLVGGAISSVFLLLRLTTGQVVAMQGWAVTWVAQLGLLVSSKRLERPAEEPVTARAQDYLLPARKQMPQ